MLIGPKRTARESLFFAGPADWDSTDSRPITPLFVISRAPPSLPLPPAEPTLFKLLLVLLLLKAPKSLRLRSCTAVGLPLLPPPPMSAPIGGPTPALLERASIVSRLDVLVAMLVAVGGVGMVFGPTRAVDVFVDSFTELGVCVFGLLCCVPLPTALSLEGGGNAGAAFAVADLRASVSVTMTAPPRSQLDVVAACACACRYLLRTVSFGVCGDGGSGGSKSELSLLSLLGSGALFVPVLPGPSRATVAAARGVGAGFAGAI